MWQCQVLLLSLAHNQISTYASIAWHKATMLSVKNKIQELQLWDLDMTTGTPMRWNQVATYIARMARITRFKVEEQLQAEARQPNFFYNCKTIDRVQKINATPTL